MDKKADASIAQAIAAIKPLPAAVRRLCAMADDPQADFRQMARVIAADCALTARVLRIANSAFYGLSHRISTIPHAFSILGVQGVRNIALSACVIGFRSKGQTALDMEAFWKRSVAVASAAWLLALRLGLKDPEEAFVCGILHNIGRVVLAQHFRERYPLVLARARRERIALEAAEAEDLGASCSEIGRAVCEHWKLPSSLAAAVAHRCRPPAQAQGAQYALVLALQGADNLVKIAGIGDSGCHRVTTAFIPQLRERGIDHDDLRAVLLELPEKMQALEALLDMAGQRTDAPSAAGDRPPIAVSLSDPGEQALVALSILAMGYTPVTLGGAGEAVDVVVTDGVATAEAERLLARGAVIADFAAWKSTTGAIGTESIDAEEMRAWLAQTVNLPTTAGGKP